MCGASKSIDIIFDNYFSQSIKQLERVRRAKGDAVITVISGAGQPMPIDMDAFWASSENKVSFQQMFIDWVINTYDGNIAIYLGGLHPDDVMSCKVLHNGNVKEVLQLKCFHEEADDRIMFHINHCYNCV